MKKIIIVLILALLASSCNTPRVCRRQFPDARTEGRDAGFSANTTDSIQTVTLVRDTTIYIFLSGDSVEVLTPMDEVSRLNTTLATSTVWLKDGKINHRLEQKDTIVPKVIKGALKTTITSAKNTQTIIKTRNVNFLSGWQWTQIYLGRVFLGALAAIILWGILKRNLIKI